MQVSLFGELSHMGHGTYPRATRLQNGSILGVHTAFQKDGSNTIPVVRSVDNGITWISAGEVTRGIGDIDNAFVIQLPSRRILCAFRNHSKDSGGGYTYFRITICCSDDDGNSWRYLSTADQNVSPVTGLWEPFMRVANDGSLQLYYSKENAGNDQDSILRISKDGGETWSEKIVISGEGIMSRDGMLGVAPYGNSLIAVFETNEDGPMSIKCVSSLDDGKTWGNRQLVYRAREGRKAIAPQIVNCGGALAITFMTDEDGSECSVKMLVGSEPGKSMEKVLVSRGYSCWAGVLTLDNSSVLVMMDQGGCKSQVIKLSRHQ